MNGCAVRSAISRSAATSSRRRADVAEGDEGRHPPGHRLGADLGVAELLREVLRLGEHVEDLLERAGPARPVGAHQHRRQSGAVAQLPGHRDRIRRARPRRARARPGSRAPGRVRRAARPAEPISRRRARWSPLREGRARPGRRNPGASSPLRSRSPLAPGARGCQARRAISAAAVNASSASGALPAEMTCRAEFEICLRPVGRALDPQLECGSQRAPRLRQRPARRSPLVPRAGCTRRHARRHRTAQRRRSGAPGRRARGRRSRRRLASASPTARCSSARRMPHSRS